MLRKQDFCEICGEPSDDLHQGVCPTCLMEGDDSDFAEDEDEEIENPEEYDDRCILCRHEANHISERYRIETKRRPERDIYESCESILSEGRGMNPGGLVSVWLSKEKFPMRKNAFRWLLDHGFETRIRSSDNFWASTQNESLVRKYKSKIRSKYIRDGVMIRFVPSRFIK